MNVRFVSPMPGTALDAVLAASRNGEALAVALGNGLEPLGEREALAKDLCRVAATTRTPVLLWTRRGSIGAYAPHVLDLCNRLPSLRLAVDLADWYFGSEMILGRWADWRALMQQLAPRTELVVDGPGGAERVGRDAGLIAGGLRQRRARWLRRMTTLLDAPRVSRS